LGLPLKQVEGFVEVPGVAEIVQTLEKGLMWWAVNFANRWGRKRRFWKRKCRKIVVIVVVPCPTVSVMNGEFVMP